ncbi:hypothetical protein, partial [Escherichia coli]|uniref:hypothetical protein n=1 Tax=Escherichia coli TaxID=562 RepID=UPI0035B550D2
PSAKGDDKFITTDYLQQCRGNRVRGERNGPHASERRLSGSPLVEGTYDRGGQGDSKELLAGHHHPNDARAPGLSD